MSESLHIIVSLSPETIAALAEALRPKPAAPAVLYARRPYETKERPLDDDYIRRALEGRAEVTIREVMAALGVPEEKRTRATAFVIGQALRRLGWAVAGQRGGPVGARERYYRPAAP